MHDLIPTTALGEATPRRDEIGRIVVAETQGLALASVAARLGQETAAAEALSRRLGVAPPGPGRAASGAGLDAIWTGPEQLMVAASLDAHDDLVADLAESLGGSASMTEQSDAWAVFELSGETVVDMLERLCPVPSRRMTAGDVTRTTLDHLGCFVWCLEAGRTFRVLGPRSAAHSLHHALITAAGSVA